MCAPNDQSRLKVNLEVEIQSVSGKTIFLKNKGTLFNFF